MSTRENKDLIRQFYKEWNVCKGDMAKMRSVVKKSVAPGYVLHHVSRGDVNADQVLQHFAEIWAGFPDFNMSVDDMVAEGDKVAIRVTAEGTHKETYMGIPATGKLIAMKGVIIDKIVAGKFAEAWEFPDSVGLMIQLGVIPGAAPKK